MPVRSCHRLVLATLAACLLHASPARSACILAGGPEGPWLEKTGEPSYGKQITPRESPDRGIDVTLYELELTVSALDDSLAGVVTITFAPTRTLDAIVLDFATAGLEVSSLTLDGNGVAFTHASDLLTIPRDPALAAGVSRVVEVTYTGRIGIPDLGIAGFKGGYWLRYFSDAAGFSDPTQPVIATLSEPDAARAWWPCHDWPHDAAQVRIAVTGPDHMIFAGPGLRTADADLGNGLRRQEWWMPTEIPSYLVSLAVARYATAPGDHVSWRETATVRDNAGQPVSVPVEYYVPPLLEAAARASWTNTPRMMAEFDAHLGPYPYWDLKYGMAMFVFGGAMEHPTISSMSSNVVSEEPSDRTGGPSWEWITAHELIHQWFGDCARVERWGEIWLNEGFASYGEVLWYEWEYGYEVGKNWLIDDKWRPSFNGPIVDPSALFGTTVYRKGAWFLHMLRQVLGEDTQAGEPRLLAAMRAFLDSDPSDAGPECRPVTSADFQAACEQVLRDAGRLDYLVDDSLDWMFEPWLTREGRPQLGVGWVDVPGGVRVSISQPAGRSYRLPLPVRVRYADDSISATTVEWVDGNLTEFTLSTTGPVAAIEIDPDRDWLLDIPPGVVGLAPPYPNPFNPSLTVEFYLDRGQRVDLVVFDVRGRSVDVLAARDFSAGSHRLVWEGRDRDGAEVASGVYYLQLRAADGLVETRKATLLR